MFAKRLMIAGVAIGTALGLGACTDGYGYGGLSTGYGVYGGVPYYDGYGAGSYGYAPSYFGWYGDYYYPGAGVYVYDQYRRPYRWNNVQQRYWASRSRYRGQDGRGPAWSGFDRGQNRGAYADGRGDYRGNPGYRPDRNGQGGRGFRRDGNPGWSNDQQGRGFRGQGRADPGQQPGTVTPPTAQPQGDRSSDRRWQGRQYEGRRPEGRQEQGRPFQGRPFQGRQGDGGRPQQ
ncbi:MAG TPA: hypothetical protein VFQ57_04980 [Sphingomonas sp.]|jgi:hypothetical protein|nr:hypothetical protein [Sphingomonas sp.]